MVKVRLVSFTRIAHPILSAGLKPFDPSDLWLGSVVPLSVQLVARQLILDLVGPGDGDGCFMGAF